MRFKNTLLREAMQVFQEHGIDAISEAELLRRLDISEATYKGFFTDKEDLLLQAYNQQLEDDKQQHERISESAANPIEELLNLIEYGSKQLTRVSATYIQDVIKRPAILTHFAQHAESYSYPQVYNLLERGIETGYFRPEIPLPIVTRIILENVYLLLNTRAFPPEQFQAKDIFRSIYLYYIRGLCSKEHIDLLEAYFAR